MTNEKNGVTAQADDPRSLQTTPDDIERSIRWINDFRKNGLPG